ncbi:radical SAM protein [bacterium]|nr:radical SAM protein [bacterium]
MQTRIYKILKHTKVEGPGIRYCIWFQGCSKHCKGCWAKNTWDYNGGKEYDAQDILVDILSTPNIEGITFLGGEPFEQPEVIKFLAENVQKKGLSVLCFTGNEMQSIKEKYSDILKNIDILIDGHFDEQKKDYSRPWVGSSNQKYYFLSQRYNPSILEEYKNKIEVNIQKNGMVFINGMGDFEKVSNSIDMFQTH